MTALCGGGSSAPKGITDAVTIYSAGRLAQLAVEAGAEWTNPVIPLISLLPLVASSFCSSDPPSMSALTNDEATAVLNLDFGTDFYNGLGKIKDAFLNLIWNDMCECTSGTYAKPVPPSPPSDTPIFQPPVPGILLACKAGNIDFPSPGSTVTNTGTFIGTIAIPAGAVVTSFRISGTLVSSSGSPSSVVFTGTPTVSGSSPSPATSHTAAVGVPFSFVGAFGSTANELDVKATSLASSSTVQFHLLVELFCNGDIPGNSQQPCCPPDESTQAYLDLILKQVNLIQRQAVPFAYVSGAVHTGLSGAGTISISGLLGASVSVTTIPSSYGRSGTTPTEYFELGFLTFGTADGFPSAYKLERETLLMLPPRCSAYTELDYDLAPGVVVTITELLREP